MRKIMSHSANISTILRLTIAAAAIFIVQGLGAKRGITELAVTIMLFFYYINGFSKLLQLDDLQVISQKMQYNVDILSKKNNQDTLYLYKKFF